MLVDKIKKKRHVFHPNENIELLKNVLSVLKFEIEATIHTFYRTCNEFRFHFSILSSDIKSRLISTYCMYLYGSQL